VLAHLLSLAELYLVGVVGDSRVKPFQLPVDEATVGVNSWVLVIELKGSIEIDQGLLEFAHVTIAASSIMKIDWALGVNFDGLREVFDGFVELGESVLYETSTVEGRSVVRIEVDHLNEVLESQLQPITAHLLSNSSQMMECRHVLLLEGDGSNIVLL